MDRGEGVGMGSVRMKCMFGRKPYRHEVRNVNSFNAPREG